MANDPNRDILPVKESFDRACCDRIEPHLVSRYRRPDLEDKFIKLYEENIELKRLNTTQDGKIKKLGTKLARYLRDKNGAQQFFGGRQADAELEMKVHELERENYSLKDKNTVLKQQLASHSRQHMAAHRSPVRYHPTPSSARSSQRQPSVPNIHEDSYTLSNRHSSSEFQLQDAEAHIAALNDEIKRYEEENKSLKMEIEKTIMVSQRAQDGENIELIRLRQQKKHLEAQLRVAEHSQKLLKQDLTRLQNENEDALAIIAERQNEIIDLQSKLDDSARLVLELQESKEIISDLTRECDILKERCEALMLTIRERNVDAAAHAELKRQLSDAKSETAGLRQELELVKIPIEAISRGSSSKNNYEKNDSCTQTENNAETSDESTEIGNSQPNSARSVTLSDSPYDIMQQLAKSRSAENKLQGGIAAVAESLSPATEPNPINSLVTGAFYWSNIAPPPPNAEQSLTAAAERLNLQREADCLRELLRAQTQRCDLQDSQIMRLQQEMRMKEERYKDVFQQRDLFFRLLEKDGSRVQSARTIKEPDGKIQPDSEDSEDCPSQCTYVKRNGTYTKNSPGNRSSAEEPSPVRAYENGKEKVIVSTELPQAPVPVPRKRLETQKAKATSIRLTILWLRLEAGSSIMLDPGIKALYVDFTILSKSSEDFETPQALPKPQNAEDKLAYDFTAEIIWEESMLKNLKTLKDKNPQGDCIIFNIVSEPVVEESASEVECPIVGISVIGFHQFALSEEDEELLLPVYEVGKEKKSCGTLSIRLSVPASIFKQF